MQAPSPRPRARVQVRALLVPAVFLCNTLSMYALVWGRSTKHSPQTCGLEHQLTDEDVIQVLKKSGKGSGFGKAQQATSGRLQKS